MQRAFFLNEFKILQHDSVVKTINPQHLLNKTVKNLEPGLYEIEYKTKFQELHRVKIDLSTAKEYHVDLCLDYIDYENSSHTPFIHQLKYGESYSIKISSRGCFHQSEELLTVSRNEKGYYISYNDKKVLLNPEEISAIGRFEIELTHMESLGCTTEDLYTIEYQDQVLKRIDGSCSWNGGYFLMQRLKLIDE